jgi:putative NADH-flavin reductase
MRLIIFGATGKTGLPLTRKALAAGHEVIALARTPSKLNMQHPCLKVVQGDAMNAADVEKVIALGGDVVYSTLGHGKGTPRDMQTVAIGHIIAAMKRHNLRRLVALTGAGVRAPQDQPGVPDHIIRFLLKTLSGPILEDAANHVALIEKSGLDWVIVRGPMLTEAPGKGKYRVGWVGVNTSPRIAREDLADFMLTLTTEDRYLHQMPMVSD